MNELWPKQKSAEVDIYTYQTSDDGRTTGGRTSGRAQKSVNLAWVRGSGCSEKVGRPVVPGAPDVRKGPVVQWVGVNAGFEIRDVILGGKWRFWDQN